MPNTSKKPVRQKQSAKKKEKKSLSQLFFKAMATTFIVVVVLMFGLVLLYNKFLYNGDSILGIGGNKEPDPINKTLAVFGVDEDGYRTDVIFVVNFNSQTAKTRVISIPRDTKVTWTNEQRDAMRENKGYSVRVSKLNEMTSYAGIENIRDYTISQIEDILDIQIDNYVIVTLDAFKQIVDAIGGVEVDVPVLNGNGLHYDDYAGGLHIHLDPGLQVLNGEQAEGLVRFRKGYLEGDVGRIRTQQLFLEAFAKKVTSPSIITKLPGIINTVFNTVKTDMRLTDIPGYLPYLKTVDLDGMSFNIIPGQGAYEGGKSYFFPDMKAMPGFIEEIFNDTEEEEAIIDKEVSIEILNAIGISGVAGSQKDILEAEGYTIDEIGNTVVNNNENTVIYAKDISLATQFKSYYPKAIIKEEMNMNYDIKIVLGKDIN